MQWLEIERNADSARRFDACLFALQPRMSSSQSVMFSTSLLPRSLPGSTAPSAKMR